MKFLKSSLIIINKCNNYIDIKIKVSGIGQTYLRDLLSN